VACTVITEGCAPILQLVLILFDYALRTFCSLGAFDFPTPFRAINAGPGNHHEFLIKPQSIQEGVVGLQDTWVVF
jgi:hypothetical protein